MMESQLLIQTETRMEYTESTTNNNNNNVSMKKTRKKSMKKSKDENNISVSKGSEKLSRKMQSNGVESNPLCNKCEKPVYAMERIKAEKKTWHKECFQCIHCNRQLTVETYQSHEGNLYCKQHFRSLFAPRVVEDDEPQQTTPKKHQMIICESNPIELPPDVVRASDKPDLGLEELSSLDVKSRFEMFEKKSTENDHKPQLEDFTPREKSATLLSKLAKFKSKGMDIGVSDEYLNGIPIEPSSSEGEEEDADKVLRNSYKHTVSREQPVSFCNMSEIVGKFESGDLDSAERRLERKQEIQNIRCRLFLGKQSRLKEMYEQSVAQSEQSVTSADKIARVFETDDEKKAKSIMEKFETGEVFQDNLKDVRNKEIEDESLFNEGIGKQSRTIFLELDANAKVIGAPLSPPVRNEPPPKRKEKPFVPKDVVRSEDRVDDVKIETSDISNKFKFFETYKPKQERKEFRMTPPRDGAQPKAPSPELYRDPNVVRSDDPDPETGMVQQRHTASRMINVFEKRANTQDLDQGPKPMKSFTPPLDGAPRPYTNGESSEEETDSEEERQNEYEIARQREIELQQAQAAARARNLKSRFENWSESDDRNVAATNIATTNVATNHFVRNVSQGEEDDESQIETAKSLREKFENMRTQTQVTKTFMAQKVNRFVDS